MAKNTIRQPYPREDDTPLSKFDLFPMLTPPMPEEAIQEAIENAFLRSKKAKTGETQKTLETPEELVKACIKHLKERADPVLGTSFYSQLDLKDIFDMDEIPHEMQRLRMRIGLFYQYLMIELMRSSMQNGNQNIKQVFDGMREGDIVADIITPSFDKNLRLYISVKKSSDTVGGQDIGGVIKRLEDIGKTEKNLTSPYLCVIAIATPNKGKVLSYDKSRSVRYNQDGHPYSENCEIWMPGFIYPYVTGRSATEIYKKCLGYVDLHLPFYSLKHRDECAILLKEKFIDLGIVNEDGSINKERFFKYVVRES